VNLTDAIKEAYEHAPADLTYYDTLEIACAEMGDAIRVVVSHQELTTNDGTFLPVPTIDFSLPETAGSVRGQMTIRVPGVPLVVREKVRLAALARSPITVKYRQYLEGEMEADAELPALLSVTDIRETWAGIEITAMLPDLVGAYFPRRLMTWDALFNAPFDTARVTQQYVEILEQKLYPARITNQYNEILVQEPISTGRVTNQYIEVLVSVP